MEGKGRGRVLEHVKEARNHDEYEGPGKRECTTEDPSLCEADTVCCGPRRRQRCSWMIFSNVMHDCSDWIVKMYMIYCILKLSMVLGHPNIPVCRSLISRACPTIIAPSVLHTTWHRYFCSQQVTIDWRKEGRRGAEVSPIKCDVIECVVRTSDSLENLTF